MPDTPPNAPKFDKLVMVRLTSEMHARLVADAEANGRTVSQSARLAIQRALGSSSP